VTVRFLADEDLHAGVIDGLRSRESAIDVLDAKTAGMRGEKDTVLLDFAARQDRILITHDRNTMTWFFMERVASGKSNPGIFMIPQMSRIGEIIDTLLLVWAASQAEEWRNADDTV
jgi:predicted nuclease of predicted toxin-antitoxin system